jgi:hypothetical protein
MSEEELLKRVDKYVNVINRTHVFDRPRVISSTLELVDAGPDARPVVAPVKPEFDVIPKAINLPRKIEEVVEVEPEPEPPAPGVERTAHQVTATPGGPAVYWSGGEVQRI